jgi:hypothetical protein
MSAIIYDFKPIGGTLRKHRLDDWWNPAKPEPEAERLARQDAVMRKLTKEPPEEMYDPLAGDEALSAAWLIVWSRRCARPSLIVLSGSLTVWASC